MAWHQPGGIAKDQAQRQIEDDREDQERGEGDHRPIALGIDEPSQRFDSVGRRRPQQRGDRTER
ncbi:MAG TPA: hypothetical protein VNZ53_15095 [Steroidobacteraceae bacterium]|nr:hypothetical protein [Steroidobacteraceae bacterium]